MEQGVEVKPEQEERLREYHSKVRQAKTGVGAFVFFVAVAVAFTVFVNREGILASLNAVADSVATLFN